MRPLAEMPPEAARRLEGLLFDLDDTLLSEGRLERRAYMALCDLADAGLRLVAVTGRPSGWGEVVARQWPIHGVVAENGAVRIHREGRGLVRRESCDEAERRSRRIRLARLVERASEVVPEARLADDVEARRSDVAWDIGERVRLPEDRVAALVVEILEAGARVTRSSVHLHASFDTEDKAHGAVVLLRERFGEDEGRALHCYGYVGDSSNDAPCFAAFRETFGVSNVARFVQRLPVPPRWITRSAMGEGFAELASSLLSARA